MGATENKYLVEEITLNGEIDNIDRIKNTIDFNYLMQSSVLSFKMKGETVTYDEINQYLQQNLGNKNVEERSIERKEAATVIEGHQVSFNGDDKKVQQILKQLKALDVEKTETLKHFHSHDKLWKSGSIVS